MKLIEYKNEEEPVWMKGLDDWKPRILDGETRTIAGGRGAKREKKRTVKVRDIIVEVDEDVLQVLEGENHVLETICQIKSPTPLLDGDGRLHKALMYLPRYQGTLRTNAVVRCGRRG